MRTEENLCLQPRNQTHARGSLPALRRGQAASRETHVSLVSHTLISLSSRQHPEERREECGPEAEGTSGATQQGAGQGLIAL